MLDIDSKVSFSKLNPQRMVKLPLSDKYLQSVCNYLLNTFSPGSRICPGCVQGGQGLVLLMGQSKHLLRRLMLRAKSRKHCRARPVS